jgi:hypothetical protein
LKRRHVEEREFLLDANELAGDAGDQVSVLS